MLEHRARLTQIAVELPFIAVVFSSALFPPHFPQQNLTMMPMCAAPRAPAVQSIMKCTPSCPALLPAPVLPGLDLPTSSRKVGQRGIAGRQRGEHVEEGREGIHHEFLINRCKKCWFPWTSGRSKIVFGKDYSKPADKIKLWAQ